MKPAWDQLMSEYADSNVVVGDVDCTSDEAKNVRHFFTNGVYLSCISVELTQFVAAFAGV